jgi:hypothetical protein
MTRWLAVPLLAMALLPGASAEEPAAPPAADACLVLNNRILGPRAPDRLLPLLSGDPARGFHPACAVPWSKLSPTNQALPITECYRGSLLQVANDAACGRQTGALWVNARWVVTSGELQDRQAHAALCQQLETGAWAGTRDLKLDCVPQKKEMSVESAPAPQAAAKPAPTAAPPAATSPAPPAITPRPER